MQMDLVIFIVSRPTGIVIAISPAGRVGVNGSLQKKHGSADGSSLTGRELRA
jgi:hypothetical protein